MEIGPDDVSQWKADCMKWRGRILTGYHAHWCYDWDGLPVLNPMAAMRTTKMAVHHAIERTSPKGPGSQFLGTCRLCGITNLPASAARLECENPRGLTNDEALLETIEGVKAQFDGAEAYEEYCNELERLRATILNIQALAERGFPIDNAKLAERCRKALSQHLP